MNLVALRLALFRFAVFVGFWAAAFGVACLVDENPVYSWLDHVPSGARRKPEYT